MLIIKFNAVIINQVLLDARVTLNKWSIICGLSKDVTSSLMLKDLVIWVFSKVRGNLFLSMTEITYNFHSAETICDALCDVIPFAQFKKRENIIGGRSLLVKSQALACNFTKSNTTSCFSHFLNCANSTKLSNALHMVKCF